jgi:hypothetical protein
MGILFISEQKKLLIIIINFLRQIANDLLAFTYTPADFKKGYFLSTVF